MRFNLYLLIPPLMLAMQQSGVQTPVPRTTSPAPERGATHTAANCAIEGQVLNAATGEPVKKAYLVLRRDITPGRTGFPESYSTATDAGGKFAIKDIEPGKYHLWVNRTGFVSSAYGARGPMRPGATLSLEPGQRIQDVVFRLTPHAVISGRVLDEDGEPVANVQVQTMRYRFTQGRKQLMASGGASTNDLGEYRIYGLAPGRYYLSATYRPGMMFEAAASRSAGEGPEEEYVPTYYPGATNPASATQVEVAPGAHLRGTDFTLSKTRTVRIRGRVINSSGMGRQNMMLMLMPRDQMVFNNMNRTHVSDPQGNFEIRGVAPGAYTLVVSIFDEGKNLTVHQPVEVGASNVEDVNITITPGLEITGTVRVEGPNTPNLSDVRLILRPRNSSGIMFGGTPSARVKENNSFTLANVNPDHYDLSLFGLPEGYYVLSMRMGDEDVLEPGLNLTRGSAAPVEVVLSPNAGQVEGVVVDAKQQPVAGATVVLVPEPKRRDQMQFYKNTNTDQYGRFTFKSLDPAEYKLFAWEDVEYGEYMDPDFLKPVEDLGQSLSIREGSRESQQITVIPAPAPSSDRGKSAPN